MSEKHLEAVNAVVLAGGNKAQAADDLNIPVSTLKTRLRSAKTMGIEPTVLPPDEEARLAKLKLEYEDQIRALQGQLKNAQRETISADMVRSFYFNLQNREPNPPGWVIKTSAPKTTPGVPTLFLSDFHWGEVVAPEQVSGINAYDSTIASERFKRTIHNAIDVAYNHMVDPKYDGLVLPLGGDMLSGDIHEELAESNDQDNLPGLLDIFDHFIWGIDALADKFGRVYIPTAFGNHGRTRKKVQYKNAAYFNLDWVLYNLIERHFKKDDRVYIDVTNSFDTYYRVANTNYLLTHGDRLGARGGDGWIGMLGPIVRGTKKVRAQYEQLGRVIHYVIMGHWHMLDVIRSQGIVVNGSLKGYDEFAMGLRFAPQMPEQAMWWTHPDRGLTFYAPIFCEGRDLSTDEGETSWVSLPR